MVLGFGLLDVRPGPGYSGLGLGLGGFRLLHVQLHRQLVDFRQHLACLDRAGIIHHLAVQILAELHDDAAYLGAHVHQFVRFRDARGINGNHHISPGEGLCLIIHLERFVPLPLLPGEPGASKNGNDDDDFDESLHDYNILRNNEKVAHMLKLFRNGGYPLMISGRVKDTLPNVNSYGILTNNITLL